MDRLDEALDACLNAMRGGKSLSACVREYPDLAPELEEQATKVQEEVSREFEEAERALEMMRQEGEAEEMAAE